MPQKDLVVNIVQPNFPKTLRLWGKINTPSLTGWHFKIISFEYPHDDIKIFPQKVQNLQRQTGHNKAEQQVFCWDISHPIKSNPGLLNLIFCHYHLCTLTNRTCVSGIRLIPINIPLPTQSGESDFLVCHWKKMASLGYTFLRTRKKIE